MADRPLNAIERRLIRIGLVMGLILGFLLGFLTAGRIP